MSRRLIRLGWAALALPVLVLLAGQAGWLEGQPPVDLGVKEGLLNAPSPTRNSVSSQAHLHLDHPQQDYARVDAWPWLGSGPDEVMARLARTLESDPSIRIVRHTDRYLHAEARTRWLGFVDDLEFLVVAQEQRVHVRSGSRLGREDFGTNRKRVEALRAQYEKP